MRTEGITAGRVIGIQGGRGSFNEEALQHALAIHGLALSQVQVSYRYTTEGVLAALRDGEIELGQFAVHNAIDGPVARSLDAMERYDFTTSCEELARYSIPIVHCLMALPDVSPHELDRLISHPTVFAQCRATLRTKYPELNLVAGEGEWEDPARVGEGLRRGELPRSTGTLSSRRIAEIHGLRILEEGLQDRTPNISTFVMARRTHAQ